jgi:hypothetical protein
MHPQPSLASAASLPEPAWFEIPERAWLIRPGEDDELLPEFLLKQAIAFGGLDLGDPTALQTAADVDARLLQAMGPNIPASVRYKAADLFDFWHTMAVGDYVLSDYKPAQGLLLGRVASLPAYQEGLFGRTYPYVRRVQWLGPLNRANLSTEAAQATYSIRTLNDLGQHLAEIHELHTGERLYGPVELERLARSPVVAGEHFTIQRLGPQRLVYIRHARPWLWWLGAGLLGAALQAGLAWAVLQWVGGPLLWRAAAGLATAASVIGLLVVLRLAFGEAPPGRTVRTVFDRAANQISRNGRRLAGLETARAVSLRSDWRGQDDQWHRVSVILSNGREIRLDRSDDAREMRIAALALTRFLGIPLETATMRSGAGEIDPESILETIVSFGDQD